MDKFIASLTALIAVLVLYLGVSAMFVGLHNPIFVLFDTICIGVTAMLLVWLIRQLGQGMAKSPTSTTPAKRLAAQVSLPN